MMSDEEECGHWPKGVVRAKGLTEGGCGAGGDTCLRRSKKNYVLKTFSKNKTKKSQRGWYGLILFTIRAILYALKTTKSARHHL